MRLKSKETFNRAVRIWVTSHKGNDKELHRARHCASVAIDEGLADMSLYFFSAFLSFETGEIGDGKAKLDYVGGFKNYFKSNEPLNYALFLFLTCMYYIKSDDTRQFTKFQKTLDDQDFPLISAACMIYSKSNDFQKIGKLLKNAYADKRTGNVFLFVLLYKYFQVADDVFILRDIILPFLNWCLAHSFDLTDIFLKHKKIISEVVFKNLVVAEKLYTYYPGEWILNGICNLLIQSDAKHAKALYYYNQASHHQMFIKGLNLYLVKSFLYCFGNTVADLPDDIRLSRYALEDYLKTDRPEPEELVFLYHLLLSSRKYDELVKIYEKEICKFAEYCLDFDKKGIFLNSIYKYYLTHKLKNPDEKSNGYIKKIDEILPENMFKTELRLKHGATVLITEKERSEAREYEISTPFTLIETSGDVFFCFVQDADGREVRDLKIKSRKLIQNEDFELYNYYYDKGIRSDNLLIAMSRHFVNTSTHNNKAIAVITETLSRKNLSKSFKMQLNAALGNALYAEDRYDLALEYYKIVDENLLNDKLIENMVLVLLDSKEYEKAVRLIIKKGHCLSDRALFYSVKKLCQIRKFHQLIANSAYELILKSFYDNQLLEVVIEFYKGSSAEWCALSDALERMSVYELHLDEIILRNSLWVRKLDSATQAVFIRMCQSAPESKLLKDYISFFAMEMIINRLKPEPEALELLEVYYENSKDLIMCYALAHVYVNHNVSTELSDEVLREAYRNMERDKIIFKDLEKPSYPYETPFFAKNTAFMYKSVPGKNIFLHYRYDDEKPKTKKLTYFAFGLYLTVLPQFFGETIAYSFVEESKTGSVSTEERTVTTNKLKIYDYTQDSFFQVNNALIYEHMFKHEQAEQIISELTEESKHILAKII